MKKQLIALRGPSNVGKSTALHVLYRLLVSDPLNKTLSYKSHGRKLDFEAIVEVDGCKVGLVNRGDHPAQLKKLINGLAQMKCDIIVCAARTKGAVDVVLNSFDPPYKLTPVPKTPSKNIPYLIANLGAAHGLASMVYAAIDA